MPDVMATMASQHEQLDELFARVSDPEADRRDALSELIRRLAAHISVEQSVVMPALQRRGIGDQQTSKRLKRANRYMGRSLIKIERRKINSPDLPGLVTELKEHFDRHLGAWERVQSSSSRLAGEEDASLAAEVSNAEAVVLSHPHPHLLSLGPISRLTTRLAARFDRARDRTATNLP